MRNNLPRFSVPAIALILIVACSGPAPSASPTTAPLATAAVTPAPTAAATPTLVVPTEGVATPPPTPTPTQAPSVPPTPTATPAPTLSPVQANWQQLNDKLALLGYPAMPLPVMEDGVADGLFATTGQPVNIDNVIDMKATYAGWTSLGAAAFDPGGFFDCADHEVFCGGQPADLAGKDVVLGAVQTSAHIPFGEAVEQIAMAFDRTGHDNGPSNTTPLDFGGYDMAIVVALDAPGMLALEWNKNQGIFVRVSPPARVRVVSDTVFFVVALDRSEDPVVQFSSFQDGYRCHPDGDSVACTPPRNADNSKLDLAPADSNYPIDDSLGPQPT